MILVFQHAPAEGIGSISAALDNYNIACRTLHLYRDAAVEPDIAQFEGLILMGGPMSVNDPLPWVTQEIRAIQDAVDRAIPVLGICLGAQLIARALGAHVYRHPQKEIGWAHLHWTAAAQSDELFQGFPDEMVFQWHGETFDVPEGAELLAYGDVCRNQAFRAGRNVYALQFHLEVTPQIIEDWLRQDAACGDLREASAPVDPYAHAARLSSIATAVFDRWCQLVR